MRTVQREPSRRRRRFRQFSLRTLMLLLLVASIVVGEVSHRANRQRRAVDLIRRMDGRVEYAHPLESGGHPASAWLEEKLGLDARDTIDYFDTVVGIQLPQERMLEVPPPELEQNLAPLQLLPDLHEVRLYGIAGIADRDLSPLRGLTQLRTLWIDGMAVDDAAPLGDLTKLQSLSLISTQISDLDPLRSLVRLEGLVIDTMPVKDLSPLKTLRNLRRLHLISLPITDVSPLQSLPALEFLDLHYTSVSSEQVEALQAALPNCKINWIAQ